MRYANLLSLLVPLASIAATSLAAPPQAPAKPAIETPDAPFRDAKKNGNFGFISRRGTILIPPKYEWVTSFSGGLAGVRLENQVGLIDTTGKVKFWLPDGTERTMKPSDGRIWFQRSKDRRWGLCKADGKIILEPKFDDVERFSEGLAAVNVGYEHIPGGQRSGQWGYVNTDGKLVVPTTLDYADDFSDGLAMVSDAAGTRFLDKTGKVAFELEPGYANVGSFREGLAPVHIGQSVRGQDWLTRYMDRTGKTQFTVDGWGEGFHEGLAVVTIRGGEADSNEKTSYGYVDRQGKLVIAAKFAEAHPFSEGLAAVRTKKTTVYTKGDTWGYIDKSGTLRIPAELNEAHSFSSGLALVHEGGVLKELIVHYPPSWEGGTWWLMDATGKKLKQTF